MNVVVVMVQFSARFTICKPVLDSTITPVSILKAIYIFTPYMDSIVTTDTNQLKGFFLGLGLI